MESKPERIVFKDPGNINTCETRNSQQILMMKLERTGLTFKFLAVELKLVRHVLEGNGFLDVDELNAFLEQGGSLPALPLIMWSS